MKNIKSFEKLFESSPRIPRLNAKGLDYWRNKGKNGKDVMIYTHDDMDGIYSAIVVKQRMLDLGYNIKGYGVLNYQTKWDNTKLDPKMINVAVDFANMPEASRKDLIDIYIDHHGEYTEEEKDFYKSSPVIKTVSGSAYEGICRVIGKPVDEIVLYSIDMIDSAKYDAYNTSWQDLLDFDLNKFREMSKKEGTVTIHPFSDSKPVTMGWAIYAKLTFAAAFNQLLKRGDHKTIIEVIDNMKDVSIYGIYNVMKKIYPGNNFDFKTGTQKDFKTDRKAGLNTMQDKTKGKNREKKIYTDQQEFFNDNLVQKNYQESISPDGYQIIDKLMFVPTGTWANALRARSILLDEYDDGIISREHKIDFIMLQYGSTIQVCSFDRLEDMENPPVLKDGFVIDDLAKYMARTLKKFQEFFGYYDPDTTLGQEEVTVSGGHVGIGTISNIVGKIDKDKILSRGKELHPVAIKMITKYDGYKYIDLMKNKMIADLSGLGDLNWPIGMKWGSDGDDINKKMINKIIASDQELQERIRVYVEEGSGVDISVDKGATQKKGKVKDLFWNIRRQISNELKRLGKDELKRRYDEIMMNDKVMMKDDIRQIDNLGNVPSRKEWEKKEEKLSNIKSFKNF